MDYTFPARPQGSDRTRSRTQLPPLRSLSLLDYDPSEAQEQLLPPIQSFPGETSPALLSPYTTGDSAFLPPSRSRRWSTADTQLDISNASPTSYRAPRQSVTRSSMQDNLFPRSTSITDPENAMLRKPSYSSSSSFSYNYPAPSPSAYSASTSRSYFSGRGSIDQGSSYDPSSPYSSYPPSLNSNGSPAQSPLPRIYQEPETPEQQFEQSPRKISGSPWQGRSRSNFSTFQIMRLEQLWARVQYPVYDEVSEVASATGLVSRWQSLYHMRS